LEKEVAKKSTRTHPSIVVKTHVHELLNLAFEPTQKVG